MSSKPEFKKQYLQPIKCLPFSFQVEQLTKVADKELSFKELKTEATAYRKLELIKKAFSRLTNSDTFEIALEKFPDFTSNEALMKYSHLDFSSGSPTIFRSYCRQATAYARSGLTNSRSVSYRHH